MKNNKKSKTEVEYLKGEIRKLRSENLHLKRELKKLMNVQESFLEMQEAFADYSEAKEEKKADMTCPSCSRGPYVKFVIPGNREVRVCKVCNYRSTEEFGD